MPKRKQPTLDVGGEIRVTRQRAYAISAAASGTVGIRDDQQPSLSAHSPVSKEPKLAPAADPNDSSDLSSPPSLLHKPKMKLKRKLRETNPAPSNSVSSDDERGDSADAPGTNQKSTRRTPEHMSDSADNSKPKRKRRMQSPVMYDIPDVVQKETTFKGQHEPSAGWRVAKTRLEL